MWENFALARIKPLEGRGGLKVKMIHLTLFDALLFFLISSVYPRDVTQYSEHCCILGFVD